MDPSSRSDQQHLHFSTDASVSPGDAEELPQLHEDEAEEVVVLENEDKKLVKGDDTEVGTIDEDDDMQIKDKSAENEGAALSDDVNPVDIKDDAVIVLTDHENETLAVAASPTNSALLITGGMDDAGFIWDLERKTSLAKVDGGNDSVSTVSFSTDGKHAAFGSENGSVSIVFMDGAESPAPSSLEGPGDTIHFLSWHPKGPVLLAGSADRITYMWNVPKGKFMMAFTGHEDAVTCGCFTTDGKLVVTGSNDSSVRVWSPSTGATITRIQTGISGMRNVFHSADIQCLAVGNNNSTSDKLIVTGCAAGDVFISHRETSQVIAQLPRHEGGVESVAFSLSAIDRVFVAIGGADGVVRVWDVDHSTERCRFSQDGVIAKVVWHPKKPILLSACSDGSVALWDILKAELIVRLTGHRAFITDVCFNNEATCVASTSADGTVRIYDIRKYMDETPLP